MKLNTTYKLPNWALWTFVILFLLVIALSHHVYNSNQDSKVVSKKATHKAIISKIDSASTIRTKKIDQLKNTSISNAKKATQIIKNLHHEKVLPVDTTDVYMFDYISKYQFTEY